MAVFDHVQYSCDSSKKVVRYAATSLLFGRFGLTNKHRVRLKAVWLMEWVWFGSSR